MLFVSAEHNPYQLYADELTEEDRSELIHLNCGDAPWSRAATEWILGSDVWESIEKYNTNVWLYRNDSDVIVGFGSLGLTRRRWPPPDGGFTNLLIIPMLGLDYRFHGQPPSPNERYSSQVVSHLRYEALRLFDSHQNAGRTTLPHLSLWVHRDNRKAIRLYEKFGFVTEPDGARGDQLLMVQTLATPND